MRSWSNEFGFLRDLYEDHTLSVRDSDLDEQLRCFYFSVIYARSKYEGPRNDFIYPSHYVAYAILHFISLDFTSIDSRFSINIDDCVYRINPEPKQRDRLLLWASFMLVGNILKRDFDTETLIISDNVSEQAGLLKPFCPRMTAKKESPEFLFFGGYYLDDGTTVSECDYNSLQYYQLPFVNRLTKEDELDILQKSKRVKSYLISEFHSYNQKKKIEEEQKKQIMHERNERDRLDREKKQIKLKEEELKRELKREKERIAYQCRNLHEEVAKFDAKTSKIKYFLSVGADINYQEEDPKYYRKPDINYQEDDPRYSNKVMNPSKYTPLMFALDFQNERIAEYLLQEGADPFIKNSYGEIASNICSRNSMIYPILKGYELLYATFNLDIALIKQLLDSGVNVNFQGLGGYSALMIAVEQSSYEIVSVILNHNPDLYLTRDDNLGVLDLISDETMMELIESSCSITELNDSITEDERSLRITGTSQGFFDDSKDRLKVVTEFSEMVIPSDLLPDIVLQQEQSGHSYKVYRQFPET